MVRCPSHPPDTPISLPAFVASQQGGGTDGDTCASGPIWGISNQETYILTWGCAEFIKRQANVQNSVDPSAPAMSNANGDVVPFNTQDVYLDSVAKGI